MNALTISRRLRQHRFTTVAEFATEHGYAVGMPDDTGRPRVLAAVCLVVPCRACGECLPTDHHCKPLETTP
jgi:hypothetical protein